MRCSTATGESISARKKYVFVIWTQAHFHFFKNVIRELKNTADIHVLVRRFKNVERLFEDLDAPYQVVAFQRRSMLRKIFEYLISTMRISYAVRKVRPDMVLGVGSTAGSLASFLFGIPSIMFEDDEVTALQQMTYVPFTSHVLVPERFRRSFGHKEIRMKSFKELAYLHPHRFSASKDLLGTYGIQPGEIYVIVRLNAWDAYHDVGVSGISDGYVKELLSVLSRFAKVLVSTEKDMHDELPATLIRNPNHLHFLLAHASLLFTDTQTMATEAAILGTPVVRCNTFVGRYDMSNFVELEKEYGLIFNIRDIDAAKQKALQLLRIRNIREIWAQKRASMLKEKIDITAFLIWFVKCYPESASIINNNPLYQLRFA
ncbi:MAG: DUF354 domain-containing protein [candidate division WOR-3 bacterium]|nr:MAG: DUF354 domain-containing protein [candidate division WOR-3 bacterium]